MSEFTLIQVNFGLPFPDTGIATALIKIAGTDMAVVEKAKDVLGMSKSQFLRVAVVRAAEQILRERGLDLEEVRMGTQYVDHRREDV